MHKNLTGLFGIFCLVSAAGCPGHVYECDCYCVRQNPVDEVEIPEFRVCVLDDVENVNETVERTGDEDCPDGYHLSGCACTIEVDKFGDQTSCSGLAPTSDPPPAPDDLRPRPDPRFK